MTDQLSETEKLARAEAEASAAEDATDDAARTPKVGKGGRGGKGKGRGRFEVTPEVVEERGRKLETAHQLAAQPLLDPARNAGILEVYEKRHLLSLMVKRELRARYIGSKMGLAWSYINPLSRFLTFYFVFGVILGRGAIPHYAIHLFSGMVIVNYFNETFNSGTRAIMQNKSVVNKMPLPRQLYPIASMLVSLYHIGPQLVILVVVCVGTGTWHPTIGSLVAVLMAFAIVILLATGMGVMFSAINVLYRDFTRVVQIFTNMLPFTVPMMYPYSMVTQRFGNGFWHTLYLDNPIASAVLLMQRCFWYQTIGPKDRHNNLYNFQYGVSHNFPPHLYTKGLTMVVACFVFLCVAQAVFNRLDDKLPDRLAG